ncbi:MAG: tRNA (N(6)-L-threonylcarbamoyladenosine(37)-C(2))-methylthiotransferase MtaB [Firmicutes bacterium]|nr:tRNA (N(6)-L-threonylcarbamoyladenosine(37)-C(2))-methylthiotransferase MtaB [Bacillota bacterium]
MKRRVAFFTLGCKTNQYDTAVMAGAFRKRGYDVVEFGSVADVYVINTCAVTERSEAKSRQAARRAKRLNPSAVVAVAGCYPQVAPDEVSALPGVDVVAGALRMADIPDYVEEYLESGTRVQHVDCRWLCSDSAVEPGALFRGRTRAFLKIQDGCENSCSYCIVPIARGPARSRPLASIVAEAAAAARAGFKEVVLTGINMGRYGKDFPGGGPDLAAVIGAVHDIPGVERIRLSSVEPPEVTEELVRAVKRPKVCPHLHVPMQSGSDRILALMNRGYTAARFLEIAAWLKEEIPGLGLTTDVIVGFPGESEEEFDETCEVVRRAGFSRIHVFPFSTRPGTAAERLPDRVPRSIKERRTRALIRIGEELSLAFHNSLVGSAQVVLVEERCGRGSGRGRLEGLTGNYVRARFEGPHELAGELVNVRITGADREGVDGVLEDPRESRGQSFDGKVGLE